MARTPDHPATSAAPEAPRFATAWAALVYALCAFSLAWPALAGKFLANPLSDQYKAGYAFREFAAAYMKSHGTFPQWNPYLFGGMPFVAAMHGDIFYPTFLLRLVMPVDVAMTWGMILHFFLCGLATYWFLRQAPRLSFHASLVGGVAYMMAGFVSSLPSAGHDGKLFVSALLPLTLLVITWGVRDGKRFAWGFLALVVGLGVLSPHPQLLQYLLLASGAWALMLAFGGVDKEKLASNVAIQRLALAFGAVVVGAAIGAIQYLPVSEYVAWSPRSTARGYDFATSYSFPIEELINTWLPQFSGILQNYWGRNGIHFHSEYIGVAVIILASAAFGAGNTLARRRFLWFWTGTAVVSLFWAFGGNTPFFQIIYNIVPGTKFFRAPSTIFYLTTFSVAVMAAIGTERILQGKTSARFAYGWLAAAVAITLLAVAGGLTGIGATIVSGSGFPQFGPVTAMAERVEANADAVRSGAFRALFFAALACGALLLLLRRTIAPRVAGWLLVALCAIDLWSIERLYWQFNEPAWKIYSTDATTEYLKRLTQPARTIAIGFPNLPMSPSDPFLKYDALMGHRVRISAVGYHGNELGRYQQLNGEERGYDQIGNPSFWALTNTDYILVNTDTLPIAGATRVIGPVMNAAGTNVTLFKLPGEHPFAWVAPVITKYGDNAVIEAARATNFPVRSIAIFDTTSKVPAETVSKLPEPLAITTHVTAYEAGHIALTLSAPAPKGSALVVSENFYPGWKVKVDGKPATAERADLVLIGVALPEGAKQVELTFDSDVYQRGKSITVVALLIALLAMGGGAVLDRRAMVGGAA